MSSGASAPRGKLSPHPDGSGQQAAGGGPSPLTIGKRFVKQYYQVLMATPDQIHRFYQPTSVLSDGEGSSPTDPVSFETVYDGSAEKLKDRFFVKDFQIRFEFEHGAIDAQPSVNGGLLLLVTGHVVYYPSASEDEDAAVDDPIRKGFVHTFFLNMNQNGTKKSFYVHNDILRFLKNPSEVSPSIPENSCFVSDALPVAKDPAPHDSVETQQPAPPADAKDQIPESSSTAKSSTTQENTADEAPGGGVEETKDELPDVSAAPVSTPPPKEEKVDSRNDANAASPKKEASTVEVDDPKPAKSCPRKGQDGGAAAAAGGGRNSPVPPSSPAPKPTPGSWASLVAGAGSAGASAPGSTVKTHPPAIVKLPPKQAPASEKSVPSQSSSNEKKDCAGANSNASSSSNNNSNRIGNNNMRSPKRDPDCTLVIKNLADNTQESDVMALFEPFAAQTKAKVVGITVAAHRGIAFVDYDSIAPVTKALDLHQKEPIRLMGHVLEVDQKTAEQRARRAAQRGGGSGGNYRSGSPSNAGANRYGGGGRGGHRRRDGGRADRGGVGGRVGRGGR